MVRKGWHEQSASVEDKFLAPGGESVGGFVGLGADDAPRSKAREVGGEWIVGSCILLVPKFRRAHNARSIRRNLHDDRSATGTCASLSLVCRSAEKTLLSCIDILQDVSHGQRSREICTTYVSLNG